MKTNIITKQLSKEQADLLTQSGIAFESVPVLDFKVAFEQAKAKQLLATPDAVWVFTSVRAVQALNGLLVAAAAPAKIFTVGKNSADELAKHGFNTDFCGQVSEDLLAILAAQKQHPILYFRGLHYRSSIPDFCTAHDFDFRALECYHSIKTSPPANLPGCESIWVFSPLSAQAVSEWNGLSKELPIYSIGPVTSAHLTKLGFKNIKSPEVPAFENMVKLFLKNQVA